MNAIIWHCVNDETIKTAKILVVAKDFWRKRGGLIR